MKPLPCLLITLAACLLTAGAASYLTLSRLPATMQAAQDARRAEAMARHEQAAMQAMQAEQAAREAARLARALARIPADVAEPQRTAAARALIKLEEQEANMRREGESESDHALRRALWMAAQ